MTLSYNQKSALKTIMVLLCVGCVLAGIIVFVIWSGSTESVRKYCSGSALITITRDHGGSTSVDVKDHGC